MDARVERHLVRGLVDQHGGVQTPVRRVAAARHIVHGDAIRDRIVVSQHAGKVGHLHRRKAIEFASIRAHNARQRERGRRGLETAHRKILDERAVQLLETFRPTALLSAWMGDHVMRRSRHFIIAPQLPQQRRAKLGRRVGAKTGRGLVELARLIRLQRPQMPVASQQRHRLASRARPAPLRSACPERSPPPSRRRGLPTWPPTPRNSPRRRKSPAAARYRIVGNRVGMAKSYATVYGRGRRRLSGRNSANGEMSLPTTSSVPLAARAAAKILCNYSMFH